MARLKEPINLRELTKSGVQCQLDGSFINDSSSDDSDSETSKITSENSNKECIGIFDEEVYEEDEPFEVISKKMIDLSQDGKIKKRVIREGVGEKPGNLATVKIDYNGYLEFDDKPFDSTYIRKKPLTFTIGGGRILEGLDSAVQSMKPQEKSQFLIHPDYAYGKNTLVGPIPPNSTILFEVELLEVLSSGAALAFEKLTLDEQKQFAEVLKFCNDLCDRGKKHFCNKEYKKGIKDYNTALSRLKTCLVERDQLEQYNELLLKLHSNLLVTYTKYEQPRKGCTNAEAIYSLIENDTLLKIPCKVYFNHSKCLRILGNLDEAKLILEKAYKLEPKNSEIATEMLLLEKDRVDHKMKEKVLAKALLGTS